MSEQIPLDEIDVDVDVDALTRRYEEERIKRERPDATDQFRPVEGAFAEYEDDPYADPNFTRDPITETVDVLIIGGGFAGLLTAGRLRERGVTDIRILDKAADFGGTWYWNRYPGVRCDVEAYTYLPMLEETGYVPSEKYACGAEIFEHCKRVARRYDLYKNALFQTEVTEVVWDEAQKRWITTTSRGDTIASRFVVSCKGLYSKAKLPGIPGIESFEGHSFHTSRWDHDYTGGEGEGDLVKLQDKRIGIIGTGCTGIQCVPALTKWSKHLYIFQRTPSSIDVRGNRPTDPDWYASLQPGWQKERVDNFTLITAGFPQEQDLVNDGWTDMLRGLPSAVGGAKIEMDPDEIRLLQLKKMERVRRRIETVVEDKATAEALKPYYHYMCKRPGFSDDYLQTFNEPNVTLVDTAGKGVERITPKGVVVAGVEYPVDCLIYATGFEFMKDYAHEAGFDVVGRGGVKLSDHWRDGMRTLFGVQAHGFPNFLIISLVQAGISVNYSHTADAQARHIAYVVSDALAKQVVVVEPTAEAVEGWVESVTSAGAGRRAFLDSCTPGYPNHEGRRDSVFELNAAHPAGPITYYEILEQWRADGAMAGCAVEPA